MLEKDDEWTCSIKDLTDSELSYPVWVRNANCQNTKRCKWHKVTSVNWLNYSNQKTSHINWKPNDLHTCPINSLFFERKKIPAKIQFDSGKFSEIEFFKIVFNFQLKPWDVRVRVRSYFIPHQGIFYTSLGSTFYTLKPLICHVPKLNHILPN